MQKGLPVIRSIWERRRTVIFALAATLMFTACGGDGPGAQPSASLMAGTSRAFALGTSLNADAPPASRPIDTATLFDWAEVQYGALFPKGSVNQLLLHEGVNYTIRHYASTNNYLGVANGQVYGYGNFTNAQLQGFGFTADYTCSVAPKNCLLATGVALAWDSGTKSWDGSDWQ